MARKKNVSRGSQEAMFSSSTCLETSGARSAAFQMEALEASKCRKRGPTRKATAGRPSPWRQCRGIPEVVFHDEPFGAPCGPCITSLLPLKGSLHQKRFDVSALFEETFDKMALEERTLDELSSVVLGSLEGRSEGTAND